MKPARFIIIFSVIVLALLTAAVWYYPVNADFRTDNPYWNGSKDMNACYPAVPLPSLADLPPSADGNTLILIPYLDFTAGELDILSRFVATGGNLVLADDYGFGNRIVEHLELDVRFSGEDLLDPLFHYKNQRLPRVTHLTPRSVTRDTESLILNHATCLTNVDTGDALALSSSASYLDLNGNEKRDDNEPAGPLPVIARFALGKGQVILVSDPSLFINSMDTIESNSIFIDNIASITTGELYLDQSHLPPSNLTQSKNRLTSLHEGLSGPLGTVSLLAIAVILTLMPVWRQRKYE